MKGVLYMTNINYENITLNGRPLSVPEVFYAETRRLFDEADANGDYETALAIAHLWDAIMW